eukprot:TRINITY_DN27228_c0_g1_i2.p1 TRINITY_DN27228_c0_g1~~TRINITY_DN27228_c0_g1_i2.p1  ORF type:complete len:557 (-),score=48.96 TRINITY_DN27228_c0_g1_i2:422-2059(-)
MTALRCCLGLLALVCCYVALHALYRYLHPQPTSSSPYDKEECGHGWAVDRDPLECKCDIAAHFRKAGPTDIFDFAWGRCTQYMCSKNATNDTCREFLPSDAHATCDVPGWNCKCDWRYATGFFNGYENDRAKCMGMMYFLSDWIVTVVLQIASQAWKPFALLVCVSICFGERRIRCECRHWSNFKIVRDTYITFCQSDHGACDGECMRQRRFVFKNEWRQEFAWSIYFFDIGIWFYAFLWTLFLTGVALGTALAVLLVCLAVLMYVFVTIFARNDGVVILNTRHMSCENFQCPDCTCCDEGDAETAGSPIDSLWRFAEQPERCCGACCGNAGMCSCLPRCWFCRPLAWVLVRFPTMPANFWGGLLGYCLGTHQYSRRPYTSQHHPIANRFIDLLSLRSSSDDLHDNAGWRERVRAFVFDRDLDALAASPPQQETMEGASEGVEEPDIQQPLLAMRESFGVLVQDMERPFDRRIDNCQVSTFNDYANGVCWLCMEDSSPTWDKWILCGHMFCTVCSEAMLERSMPCPLCRTASFQVVRAPKANPGA